MFNLNHILWVWAQTQTLHILAQLTNGAFFSFISEIQPSKCSVPFSPKHCLLYLYPPSRDMNYGIMTFTTGQSGYRGVSGKCPRGWPQKYGIQWLELPQQNPRIILAVEKTPYAYENRYYTLFLMKMTTN